MGKWYSLIDKVYDLNNLRQGYQHVRSNKGAPGIDEMTAEEFGEWLDDRLNRIPQELATGTYQPSPVRRVEIDSWTWRHMRSGFCHSTKSCARLNQEQCAMARMHGSMRGKAPRSAMAPYLLD